LSDRIGGISAITALLSEFEGCDPGAASCRRWRPSGVSAGKKIEQTLRELAPNADITFQRTAVTLAQIEEWRLPTRPTKTSDSRSKGFGDISVELDAIEPHRLRALVREAIEVHLPGAASPLVGP
jgi:hypothetical protein